MLMLKLTLTWLLILPMNAKVQRPSVCNSMETLLVHKSIAPKFLLALDSKLETHHVTIHGTPDVLQIVKGIAVDEHSFKYRI